MDKNDEGIDEEELTVILGAWGINDIRWSETAGAFKIAKRDINTKYNPSDEWRGAYYEL